MQILYNVLPTQAEAIWPEQWSMIRMDDYPTIKHQYTISTYGRVFNYVDNKFVAPRALQSENKYLNVSIRLREGGMRTFDIHRLMLITFMPNDLSYYKGLVCNHKDGIKCHNWLWNLEWMTTRENTIHAINNGLIPMGAERNNGIASEELIRKICQMIQDGYTNRQIMEAIDPSTVNCDLSRLIRNIKDGHCHSNISKEYDFSNAYSIYNERRFTPEQIETICSLFEKNGRDYKSKAICYDLGIDIDSMDRLAKCRYYAAINGLRTKNNFQEICAKYDY